MPLAGTYLLSNVGFSSDQRPLLRLQLGDEFISLDPLDKTLTLSFDTTQRYCIGWGDLETGEVFVCPDNSFVESKYEQCPGCQRRTGFNPAFYHATSVSEKQQARNQQPHILYLAHFGPGITKVGISHAARGNRRLLEQGARSAIILDTFPTALIARQYEAKIAAQPDIAETIQLRKKVAALTSYDPSTGIDELQKTKQTIEAVLSAQFSGDQVLTFDDHYFPAGLPDLTDGYDTTEHAMISGQAVGMLGSLLFCKQQDTPLFLPLKKFIGYKMTLSYDETVVNLPARQISLF